MTDLITVPSHCMVTIRRPNGDVETLNYTDVVNHVRTMDDRLMAMVNKAMASAGRGQIISYENLSKQSEPLKPSASDLADERYTWRHNAIRRAAAGEESCDQNDDRDNTPSHKADY